MASQLLGKHLCTQIDGELTTAMIVETEAYRAPDDKASHAYGNRRTRRTETMFRSGGICYIYLCYGIHHLFNVVTGARDQAHAVLIRAVEPILGTNIMMQRRSLPRVEPRLTAGPGTLSQALGLHRRMDGALLYEKGQIWIEDHGIQFQDDEIIRSPRVGVDYAGECAKWPWRFTIKDHPFCSRPRPKSV